MNFKYLSLITKVSGPVSTVMDLHEKFNYLSFIPNLVVLFLI